jgi:hypothetical protein
MSRKQISYHVLKCIFKKFQWLIRKLWVHAFVGNISQNYLILLASPRYLREWKGEGVRVSGTRCFKIFYTDIYL